MREPHTAHRLSFMAIVLALLLVACANMGTPDGGPYDETPPRVVRTSPKQGEANVTHAKKIVIEFDEIVKIENAYEKVVISPPQIEQPDIEAVGKKVTITLHDSLKANMTYTIDFADAIVDNNEGNPLGDYAFTFSTSEQTDSMQVSGNVLDASNLEPIKGMLVGLYKLPETAEVDSVSDSLTAASNPDSLFKTTPFERISRTDGSGHFVVKGIAPGKYRIYALKDQNQNYYYDQRAEMVAFTDRIIEPSFRPDIRPDTVWHDSIHYDSIVMTPYTHYFPDDIALLAFESSQQDRHLLKNERPILQMFSLFFTAPSDTLPKITGLNFNSEDAFVIDANDKNDTLNYWIKDSLIYNLDTLEIKLDFFATDTAGNLALTTDTLFLVSKLTKERIAKQEKEKYEAWVKEYKQRVKEEKRAAKSAEKEGNKEENDDDDEIQTDADTPTGQEETTSEEQEEVTTEVMKEETNDKKKSKKKKKKDEDEDIEIPPMPEEFLEYKINGIQSIAPDKNIDFEFSEPLDSVDLSKIHFSVKVDSLFEPARFIFRQVPGNIMTYRLYAEWEPDTTYQVEIDTAAFVNIYGKRCEAQKRTITLKSLDTYSTLFVILHGNLTNPYVQLLDGNDKVIKTIKAQNNKADFYFINPGTYYMRMFCDINDNGVWDTGDYETMLQPEPVYYYPAPLPLKANWEITEDWNPSARPLAKQKPEKITKQKPDKAKTIKNRNAERENGKK
ncbi:MAG: Ig-like domain-containing protein [Prevotellaceae bacterium]|nr:Ig-like domain-containing protein [Prevotellaceae bacterium]